MRVRLLSLFAALIALVILPSTALGAPKKAQIKFSATVSSVAENAGTFNLVIQRAGNTSSTTSANLAIDPASTAVGGGVDYTYSGPSAVTFNPGETRKTIPVTIVDNSTANAPNKRIVFKMSSPSPAGTQLKNNPTTVTIVDDEGPGQIDFTSSTYTVLESGGLATISLTRTGASNLSETVDVVTQV